jgi:geranylgeranyl pyrophosphate synthase
MIQEKSLSSLIEETLKTLLPSEEGLFHTIFEAARYSLLSPGKRLRPLLTIASAKAFGASLEKALIPACSIELLHTYSLIHDDLPCMDDDDLRRGKPTLHKVYPEGQAVLAGDLLLTLAFETLSNSPDLSASQTLEMVRVLAGKSGGKGLIGGQSLDLLSEGQIIPWETLKAIHLGKTASLLSACLEIGGIVADVSLSTRKVLEQIGQEIGLSFQIIDDVLDVEGSLELLGKPLLSDIAKQKNTSVSLLGLATAKKLAQDLLDSSLEKCKDLGIENSELALLLPKCVHRSF